MTRCVALLRGVNVGGHKSVSPSALKAAATDARLRSPRTLINSGNLVFESGESPDALEPMIQAAVAVRTEVTCDVFVRTAGEWAALVAGNPYPEEADGTRLVLTLLHEAPSPEMLDRLGAVAVPEERFASGERAIYAHLPFGQGRSKLAQRLTTLGGTARNWNTVLKLRALLDG